ncbi:phage tail tape measure protein [Hoeflea sp.]|uniref:phage tail tape measure protein n=1 Tax=Hoeflea sp. TaxID=1940281 RepID=UPI003A93CA37
MSNRNMNLDVIVRMKDMLSSPLRRLTAGLRSIGNVARNIGLVGTAIAAISFMGPINQAAAFQQQLLDIAGTANLAGDAAFDFVDQAKSKFEDLALLVGQYSDTIATGAGQMIAAGVNEDLVDASIGSIGRAATAANAEFSDMAAVATSLLQTLKLPAAGLDDALGGLVAAGKEGAFELKDMARYFPTLTSQMAKFGVTGREAVNFLGSALQIARKGTADPAEAANNLKNFLSKILAPQTIKKFAEAGVDIEAVMRDAATKGINPVEAVMQKIVKLSGVSGSEIEKLMKTAKDNGLEGADALGHVREQLEKIHGAGALGDLFQDIQVMDFLIPFLGNVDEYKRIKDEVAKATGAIIDEDFETHMKGLNRQLITFKEIGKQGVREVGLAFGAWLPMINENLSAALKWMRELDKSTGGMVRQALTFAGGAVVVAAALGALGIVLPIIGAGFTAVLALFSPVGIALAAIAAGAVHVYKNWATYSPRVTRLWNRAKRGFFDLADGIRDGGKQIVFAGRDLVQRYGPVVKRGFASAWEDVKAGARGLRSFFKGFWKGLDMSGLKLDDVKLKMFERLDTALKSIKTGWEALTAFGSGVKPYIFDIGEDLGTTVKAIGRIADALGRIVVALTGLGNADDAKVRGLFTYLGDLSGGSFGLAVDLVGKMANAIAYLAEALADLVEKSKIKIDWASILPGGTVLSTIDKLINFYGAGKNSVAKPGEALSNGTSAGSSKDGSDRTAAQEDMFAPIPMPWTKPLPANNNMLPPRGALDGQSKANVAVTIKVDGPGKVTSATSDNKAVKVGNNGRIVGRV